MTQALPTLTRWRTGAAELAFTDNGGDGEPLVLLHGGGLADWFTPLAALPLFGDRRVIRVVRAGYTDAPAPDGLTVGDHAGHAAALLRHLGATPAHVVAYSSGCVVALQLAIDHPDLVRTLTLCEPPLVAPLAAPADHQWLRAELGPVMGAVMAAVGRGDLAAAFDTFMAAICGTGYRRVLTDAFGAGAVDDAVRRCGYFLTGELAAVGAWTIEPDALAQLRPPVLLVQGGASPPPVHRLVARLAGQIPGARIATVAHADHLLPLTATAELALALDGFCRG